MYVDSITFVSYLLLMSFLILLNLLQEAWDSKRARNSHEETHHLSLCRKSLCAKRSWKCTQGTRYIGPRRAAWPPIIWTISVSAICSCPESMFLLQSYGLICTKILVSTSIPRFMLLVLSAVMVDEHVFLLMLIRSGRNCLELDAD